MTMILFLDDTGDTSYVQTSYYRNWLAGQQFDAERTALRHYDTSIQSCAIILILINYCPVREPGETDDRRTPPGTTIDEIINMGVEIGMRDRYLLITYDMIELSRRGRSFN